jgi:hypothetical protein
MFVITKWCKVITDSGKDEYTHKQHDNLPFKFRLLDDDNEVYGYGYSDDCDSEKAFAPLDEYEGAYGCTSIEYKNSTTREYEQL